MIECQPSKQFPSSVLNLLSTVIVLICVNGCWVEPVAGQGAIPESTLEALKNATVFVRVDAGEEGGTGSGFLIGTQKEFGYIITNEHVVRQRGSVRRTVEVDFYSGTNKRKSLSATVLSEDPSRDLAVLRIRNIDLPKPIPLNSTTKLRETLGVFILGFPFGDALATNRLGPNVTIGKGTISSIRNNDFGNIEEVQVDGDINPGNSGGPIVFEDGSLMGVSVATVVGTQIGIGIPGETVSDMLFGRIGALGIGQKSNEPKQVVCSLTADLIDPLEKIKSLSFLYIEASRVNENDLAAGKDGTWSKISGNMKEVKLRVDGQSATGQVIIRGDFGEKIPIVHQVKFINGRNKTYYTSPGTYEFRIPEREKAEIASRESPAEEASPEKVPDDEMESKNKSIDGVSEMEPDDQSSVDDKESDNKSSDEGWLGSDADEQNESQDEGWLGSDKDEEEEGWLGNEQPEIKANLTSVPVESNEPLVGEEFECLDAKCIRLTLQQDDLISNLVWDASHEHFYALTNKGFLRKISYPGLVEVATLDIAAKCKWMEMSKTGLCVLVTGLQDIVVVDPATLNPIRKFAVGEAAGFGTSPASSIAYVAKGETLLLYDLETGKNLRSYIPKDFNSNNGRVHSFYGPRLTPDGRYLISISMQCMNRFRVKGNTLVLEEQGPSCGGNTRGIEISDDSKYVALPAGGGNGAGYSTYVYSVKNLKERVLAAEGGAYPQTIAFDSAAGLIYGQNHGAELITFTNKGLVNKSYDLAPRNSNSSTKILVHPDGHKVLLVVVPYIFSVSLPK